MAAHTAECQRYGLSTLIPQRVLDQALPRARAKAESLVPTDPILERRVVRLEMLGRLGCIGIVALVVAVAYVKPLALAVPPLVIILLGLHLYAEELRGTRARAVAETTGRVLREDLTELEEDIRFYFTPEWRELRGKVIERDGMTCRQCQRALKLDRDLTVDHIVPRSRCPARALDPANLQVLCRSCNSAKGARPGTSRKT